MPDRNAAFVGSIPENYDRYLGPVLFDPYAADLVQRLRVADGSSVLELACGTGIVTRRLRDHLPSGVKLVATDLNEAMMNYAARKFGPHDQVEWKQADASELPFADETFNAVVCQFGLMFVPDKEKAVSEAHRVLKPGGAFLFSVWDKIERNDLANTTHDTVSTFFQTDPPNFYEVPFSLYDPDVIKSLATAGGFENLDLSPLDIEAVCPSAVEVAKGLVQGNPIATVINERQPENLSKIIAAVATAVAHRCGDKPVKAKMRAWVCTAVR